MVRRLLILVVACAHPGPSGPAWPRPQAGEGDGGESLAPREAARAIAAAVEDERPADRAADKPAPASAPGAIEPASADKPAPATPSVTVSEEPIIGEEIVIELDD